MRVLITRTDRIGDVMISTPVIKAVRDAYPDGHLAFCVQPYAIEIVDKNPFLDEVIVYDKKGKHKSLFGMLDFIGMIRRKKFDMAIILHPTNRMNLTCFLAGIPRRVGYDHKLGFLLTDKVPHTKHEGEKHETEYTLDIVRHIGVEVNDRRLYMSLHSDTEGQLEKIFSQHGLKKESRIIALNPSASCPSKRWPAERFSKLADTLNTTYNTNIVILGSQDDLEYNRRVVEGIKSRVIDLTGKTTISVLAGILSKSQLFISNDSGPVHIAVSVGTPVIAIFGRKDSGLSPKRWGPRGARDVVFNRDVGCEVCRAHECEKEYKCLSAITVEEVLEAAGKFL